MSRIAFCTLLTCLLIFTAAQAEDVTGRLGLGLEGGLMKLIGGDNDYSNMDQFAGFRLRRGISEHWSLELALKYGWVRPGVFEIGKDAGLTLDAGAGLFTVIWQPRAGMLYHFAPQSSFSPYLGVGVGATSWNVKDQRNDPDVGINPGGATVFGFDKDGIGDQELKNTNFTATAALGFELFLSSGFALDLGARYHYLLGNDLDNVGLSAADADNVVNWAAYEPWGGAAQADVNKGLVEAYLGFTVFFGSTDGDGDGLKDKEDGCPDAAEDFDGFQDMDGCPDLDNDEDGVLDVSDACPEEAEDRDGFQDEDGCPDPDNDGDGVADAQDQCADEMEDIDGFQDGDGCPDPDNDGDGVLDARDVCPNTPAGIEVDEKGCPVVQEIKEDLILEGVNFRSGSDELMPESLSILMQVSNSLRAWPEVTLEIRGHTDSSGAADMNRDLSQRRAISVRDFLIAQGIDPSRLTATGLGEDFPIASNDTREGRAKNRRVELHRTN